MTPTQIIGYGRGYAEQAFAFARAHNLPLRQVRVGQTAYELRADGVVYHSTAPNATYSPTLLREQYAEMSEGSRRVPITADVQSGASTFQYVMVSDVGRPAHVANAADDVPEVTISTQQFAHPMLHPACFYRWRTTDERAAELAAANGWPLSMPEEKAAASFRTHVRYADAVLLVGVTELGVGGLFTDEAATDLILVTGDWLNPATTSEEIYEDCVDAIDAVRSGTLNNWRANRLVLGSQAYDAVLRRTLGLNAESIKTVLERNFADQGLVVETSSRLDAVGLAVPGDTIVAYALDPDVLEAAIPIGYAELPAQRHGLDTRVYAESELTGAILRRGAAVVHASGAIV